MGAIEGSAPDRGKNSFQTICWGFIATEKESLKRNTDTLKSDAGVEVTKYMSLTFVW